MTPELAQFVAAWPLGASLAAAVAVRGLRVGRRRTALNEALHELRRPLQALALAFAAAERVSAGALEGSLRLAAAGAGAARARDQRRAGGISARAPIPVRPLLEAAVGRWRARAALGGRLAGAALEGGGGGGRRRPLRARAGARQPDRQRDRARRARGRRRGARCTAVGCAIAVVDSGRGSRPRLPASSAGPSWSPGSPVGAAMATACASSGGPPRAHGGDFRLRRSERRTRGACSSCHWPAPGRRRREQARAGARLFRRGADRGGRGGGDRRRLWRQRRPWLRRPAAGRRRPARRSRPDVPIEPGRAASALELRRVPARFLPPGALAEPGRGDRPGPHHGDPAGSYLLASQLRSAAGAPPGLGRGLGHGRHPVEIAVSGAEALLVAGVPAASANGSTWS